jgi:hypothetical protein
VSCQTSNVVPPSKVTERSEVRNDVNGIAHDTAIGWASISTPAVESRCTYGREYELEL